MHEEGKQPQYMQEREYKKLFGLEIYLTPVFVISSIAIVAFIIGSLIFQEGATKLFGGPTRLAYHKPRLAVHGRDEPCFSLLFSCCPLSTWQSTPRGSRCQTRVLLPNMACHAFCGRRGYWASLLWCVGAGHLFSGG